MKTFIIGADLPIEGVARFNFEIDAETEEDALAKLKKEQLKTNDTAPETKEIRLSDDGAISWESIEWDTVVAKKVDLDNLYYELLDIEED
jgi:hypothetical protein